MSAIAETNQRRERVRESQSERGIHSTAPTFRVSITFSTVRRSKAESLLSMDDVLVPGDHYEGHILAVYHQLHCLVSHPPATCKADQIC